MFVEDDSGELDRGGGTFCGDSDGPFGEFDGLRFSGKLNDRPG